MKRHALIALCAASLAIVPLAAEEAAKPEYPSPPEIVAKAAADEWVAISPSDLLVMELAPLGEKPRRVVIQLIPTPFSQGHVGNIRKLAAARWWDGTSINRVQDNYVVQWGDATEKKALPEGLATVPEGEYVVQTINLVGRPAPRLKKERTWQEGLTVDPYSARTAFEAGWPMALGKSADKWPVHCYAMVGVGRNLSPDTGTGAELYTVIGHAPRHLDRNIALVGRVIEGIEHLSSLPRGTGALGFYEKEEERVPILSVRLASDMEPSADLKFEYLSTESKSFAAYADARANRRDPFFIKPAGGADICNIPVPVRRKV